MWDYDTFAEEARGRDDTVGTLLGIYRPYPPLYYEKRIEIMRSKIAANPKDADAYDNMAVAYARLNRPDEALAAIESKKTAIGATPGTTPDWYRFYSNRGSFYLMKWAGSSDKKAALPILEKGISDIENALKIDVNAHFGREKYQLLYMQWLRMWVATPEKMAKEEEHSTTPNTFFSYLRKAESPNGAVTSKEAEVALAGLIRLGTAWENVDIVHALEGALAGRRNASIAALARRRLEAIEREHPKTSMTGQSLVSEFRGRAASITQGTLDKLIPQAEAYVRTRDEWVLQQLKAGKHPDTDPNFWSGLPEPKLDYGPGGFWYRLMRPQSWHPVLMMFTALCIVVLGSIGLMKGLRWMFRRWRQGKATS
jgi:tetratricopeptide (TPR) repeat protein